MKLIIRFKDPDLIGEYIDAMAPCADEYQPTAKEEKSREKLSDKFFEWGDYGCVEIDTVEGTGRLVPRKEWR